MGTITIKRLTIEIVCNIVVNSLSYCVTLLILLDILCNTFAVHMQYNYLKLMKNNEFICCNLFYNLLISLNEFVILCLVMFGLVRLCLTFL